MRRGCGGPPSLRTVCAASVWVYAQAMRSGGRLSTWSLLVLCVAGCGRTGLALPASVGGSGGAGAGSQGGGGAGGSGGTAGQGGEGAGGQAGGGGEGAGGGAGCMVATQCDDGDACTTDLCADGACVNLLDKDDDQDGFAPLECGGLDCNDKNPSVSPIAGELCGDGSDNDCNGVADCLDPACEGVPGCACVPSVESCQNGVDDDCDGLVDCFDPQCVNTPACGCAVSEVGVCVNGFDDDCDGVIDCADTDCAQTAECECFFANEACGNGTDDDCDGLVDCADPECAGIFPCACVPPGSPELCNDGVDNDCDGQVDCADGNCVASPSCTACKPEVCDDGLDNDCDGAIDCADTSCAFAPNCAPEPEQCNNGVDDDLDGLVDCDDPECANAPSCVLSQSNCLTAKLITESGSYFGSTAGNVGKHKGSCGGDAGEAIFKLVLSAPSHVVLDTIGTGFDSNLYVRAGACEGGKELGCDDDSGGAWAALLDFTILYPGTYYVFVDGFTIDPQEGPNQGPFQLNVLIDDFPAEVCQDGLDNDGDVYVDCADPDCATVAPCSTCLQGGPGQPELGIAACTDGLDNDCDGVADCADDDCSASDYYVTECCDGDDDNGNNIPDDFNCRCASDADCPAGQICYGATARACGIPCTAFFGDVCPFVAPGSFCNPATDECQF
jgi:hypothetical protein